MHFSLVGCLFFLTLIGGRSVAAPALDVVGLVNGKTHSVNELGKSIGVSLSLGDPPLADVSIAITSSVVGMVELLPASPVVITSALPAEVKTLVIRGLDNEARGLNASFNVVFTTSSTDPAYNNLVKTFQFKNENDENESGNHAPSDIVLISPKTGATGLTHTSKYVVELPFDLDGDDLTLTLCRDTDDEFEASPQCADYSAELSARKGDDGDGSQSLSWASLSLALLLGIGFFRRDRLVLLLAVMGFSTLWACGREKLMDSFDIAARPRWTIAMTGLSPSTTYYWKAFIYDGHGNIVESPTRSFSSGATP